MLTLLTGLLIQASPQVTPSAIKVAAAPIDCIDIESSTCRIIEDILLSNFSQDRRYSAIISGDDLNRLLNLEQQKMAIGCESNACLSELAQALKVNYLLNSKLGKVGSRYTLSFSLIDTRQARVIVRQQEFADDLDSFPPIIERVVKQSGDLFFSTIDHKTSVKTSDLQVQGRVEGIAVFDLEAVHGVKKSMARVLSDILLSNLSDSGRFESVVSGEDIKQMLDMEQQKEALGCTDESCMAEIGGALGVPFMAVPTIGRLGGQFVLNLKILDVEAARVRARVSKMVRREVDLPATVLKLTRLALDHLFEGAEVVQTRKAYQRFQRQVMRTSSSLLMVSAVGAFGYSIFDYHTHLADYLAEMNTVNHDSFQSARQRVAITRWAGLAAITTSVLLGAITPKSNTLD